MSGASGRLARATDGIVPARGGVRVARVALIVFGVLLALVGVIVLLETVRPNRIVGVASWFLFALIAHDAIVAPVVFAVALLLRRAGRRIPVAVLAIVQGALVVGAIFSIVVVPEIYAKYLGPRNLTVLPVDYTLRLVLLWLAIGVVTALSIGLYALTRRQKKRLPASH